MSDFTIKCYKRLRTAEVATPQNPSGDMFHTISHITCADYVETVDNANGQTVSGYTNSGAVAFREVVPHEDTPDSLLNLGQEVIKFVVVENKHGKTTQTIRAHDRGNGEGPLIKGL